MAGKMSLEEYKETIQKSAFELVPINGVTVAWTTLTVGTFILENATEELRPLSMSARGVAFYMLHAGLAIDEELGQFPVSQTVFNSEGIIFGSASGWLKPECDNLREINESMAFQIENQLAAPGDDDYEKVAKYLELGILDAIRSEP